MIKLLNKLVLLPLITGTLSFTQGHSQNYALGFNGNGQYAISGNMNLFLPGKFTVSTLIKCSEITGKSTVLYTGDNNGIDISIDSSREESGVFRIMARIFVDGDTCRLSGKSKIEENKWYHVALSYDGEVAALTINGRIQQTDSVSRPQKPLFINSLYIGACPDEKDQEITNFFKGVIDDVKISDCTYEYPESTRIMYGQPGDPSNGPGCLRVDLQFNEGQGSRSQDDVCKTGFVKLVGDIQWIERAEKNEKKIRQKNVFQTWTGSDGGLIKSPDPAGICFVPNDSSLVISDSEINEYDGFENYRWNIFETSLTGKNLKNTFLTHKQRPVADSRGFEPTGIACDPLIGKFFVTNDDFKTVSRYNRDFYLEYVKELNNRVPDPEGVTCDPVAKRIYICDGNSGNIRIVMLDYDFEILNEFDVADRIDDPEGIAFHPETRNLFIVSGTLQRIFEYDTQGNYVAEYDISGFVPTPVAAQGLTFGLSSCQDRNRYSLYISDGGIDNDDTRVGSSKDGRIYEGIIEEQH